MKPLTVFAVAGFGLIHGAMSDLAYLLLNNSHMARPEFPNKVNEALVGSSVLPSKLLSLLRTSMDSGLSHSFLAHVARTAVIYLEIAIKCVDESDGVKGFQICMLKETGMNPHFIRLMDCMPHYEKWHDFSPIVNDDQRLYLDLFRSENRFWDMATFLKDVMASEEYVTEGFKECVAHIERFTVGFVIKNLFSRAEMDFEDKELSILGVLDAYEHVLLQVPLPLANTPMKKPSDAIPMIIRHFIELPNYQSILGNMTYDWSLMPLDTLEKILGHISLALENWPMATQLSPRFKYLDYSNFSSLANQPWCITFYEAMKSDEASILSLIVATAKFLKLPHEDFSRYKTACNNLPEKSMADILSALRGFRQIEMETELAARGIQPDHWYRLRSCDWSAYKPRLDELGPKIQKYIAMTKSDFPSNPDNLDIFMVKSFLGQSYFQSSLNLAIVALHPFLSCQNESFMKIVVDGIVGEIEYDEILDRLWSLNESVWNGAMATDIQEFLKLPVAVDLRGTLNEVKQRMHNSLVMAISAKGGDDFAVLDYKDARALPEILQTLLDIYNKIDQDRGVAYWMAASIPIFTNPAFPPQLPKTTLVAVAMMCNSYVSAVANDPVLVVILNSIFHTLNGDPGSHRALEALDFVSVKALVELYRSDAKAFTYAIIQTPNFIDAQLWPNIAVQVLHQLDFSLENLTGLETLTDYDSTLNFLRARTKSANVDLENVFFSQEDSLNILKETPDICAVCHGEFLDDEGNLIDGEPFGALHPCKHLYHRTCFKYAVANTAKVTCPICAQPVTEALEQNS